MPLNAFHSNPPIKKPIFLHVKVVAVQEVPDSKGKIADQLELQVVPSNPDHGEITLYSNLFRTPNCQLLRAKVANTFLLDDDDLTNAVGRWGKIYLVPSKWNNLSFSTVQFVAQTQWDRQIHRDLADADREHRLRSAADEAGQGGDRSAVVW